MKIKVFSEKDIRRAVPMERAITVLKDAFIQLSAGKANVPLRSAIPVRHTRVKPCLCLPILRAAEPSARDCLRFPGQPEARPSDHPRPSHSCRLQHRGAAGPLGWNLPDRPQDRRRLRPGHGTPGPQERPHRGHFRGGCPGKDSTGSHLPGSTHRKGLGLRPQHQGRGEFCFRNEIHRSTYPGGNFHGTLVFAGPRGGGHHLCRNHIFKAGLCRF